MPRGDNFGLAQLVCFTGTWIFYRRLVYNRDVNVHWTISVFWPPSRKLWVAVQVTTCRGRGHIVTTLLQATQLVSFSIADFNPSYSFTHFTHFMTVNRLIFTTIYLCLSVNCRVKNALSIAYASCTQLRVILHRFYTGKILPREWTELQANVIAALHGEKNSKNLRRSTFNKSVVRVCVWRLEDRW